MFPRSTRIVSLVSFALMSGTGLAAQDSARARTAATERSEPGQASTPLVFEGFVLEPNGSPAQGAVVVTSAGGQAVTDTLGQYRLEASVPREAESVQVTAVSAAGRNRVASTSVELPAGSRLTRVAPLLLTEGATCAPRWLPTFGGYPGAGTVHALAVYDDGGGPALYVGGSFLTAGGVEAEQIAKWDGSSWSALGSGVKGRVQALAVYDDGAGAALYAGGEFDTAGGVTAYEIAKWDGSSWSETGAGVGAGTNGTVYALAVYDDGGGAALYAGGEFTIAGEVAADYVAKWDGIRWSPLGSGTNDSVLALTVYDDGGGAALHVGGFFSTAFESGDSYLAKWGCPAPPSGGPAITGVTPLRQPGAGEIRK